MPYVVAISDSCAVGMVRKHALAHIRLIDFGLIAGNAQQLSRRVLLLLGAAIVRTASRLISCLCGRGCGLA